jgi:hypothetical protein
MAPKQLRDAREEVGGLLGLWVAFGFELIAARKPEDQVSELDFEA